MSSEPEEAAKRTPRPAGLLRGRPRPGTDPTRLCPARRHARAGTSPLQHRGNPHAVSHHAPSAAVEGVRGVRSRQTFLLPERKTIMVDVIMDPKRGLLQDDRTAQEFLDDLFEYEYCAECGGDT